MFFTGETSVVTGSFFSVGFSMKLDGFSMKLECRFYVTSAKVAHYK